MFQQQRHVQSAIANELSAGPSSIDESTVPEALQDVVLRHQVCYEVGPGGQVAAGVPGVSATVSSVA
jgi:hypothetical protein